MQPDYPSATAMPADPSNFHNGRSVPVSLIVIHCTDGHADPKGTAEMWQTPGHKSSAHFVIGQDGSVIQAVALSDTAWHAHQCNGHSIGIEHAARTPREWGPTDAGMPVTQVQLAASAALSAWLCDRFGLPRTRETIQGHAECDSSTDHADCPTGAGIDLDAYVARVVAMP